METRTILEIAGGVASLAAITVAYGKGVVKGTELTTISFVCMGENNEESISKIIKKTDRYLYKTVGSLQKGIVKKTYANAVKAGINVETVFPTLQELKTAYDLIEEAEKNQKK